MAWQKTEELDLPEESQITIDLDDYKDQLLSGQEVTVELFDRYLHKVNLNGNLVVDPMVDVKSKVVNTEFGKVEVTYSQKGTTLKLLTEN